MQKMESETASLRDQIQAATSPGLNVATPDSLRIVNKKIAHLDDAIKLRRQDHDSLMVNLEGKIAEYNRRLEDASSSEAVLRKKTSQKICALQAEINKRRGIVVHSSKSGTSKDSAQLFLESKRLIAQIAQKQQEVWELEERVAFSRNSVTLLATDIGKKLFGAAGGARVDQIRTVAQKIILEFAGIDRRKSQLLKPQT
jgi:hypothetical protein